MSEHKQPSEHHPYCQEFNKFLTYEHHWMCKCELIKNYDEWREKNKTDFVKFGSETKEYIAERLLQWIPKRIDAYKFAEEICDKFVEWRSKQETRREVVFPDRLKPSEKDDDDADYFYVQGWNLAIDACRKAYEDSLKENNNDIPRT